MLTHLIEAGWCSPQLSPVAQGVAKDIALQRTTDPLPARYAVVLTRQVVVRWCLIFAGIDTLACRFRQKQKHNVKKSRAIYVKVIQNHD